MMMETILEEPDTVDTVDNLILQAKSLYYRRRFDQVISLCNKIWEIDREEPLAWYFKGNLKVFQRHFKGAKRVHKCHQKLRNGASYNLSHFFLNNEIILGVKRIHKRNQ